MCIGCCYHKKEPVTLSHSVFCFRVGQHQNRRTRWLDRHSDELCASGSKVPTSGAEI